MLWTARMPMALSPPLVRLGYLCNCADVCVHPPPLCCAGLDQPAVPRAPAGGAPAQQQQQQAGAGGGAAPAAAADQPFDMFGAGPGAGAAQEVSSVVVNKSSRKLTSPLTCLAPALPSRRAAC